MLEVPYTCIIYYILFGLKFFVCVHLKKHQLYTFGMAWGYVNVVQLCECCTFFFRTVVMQMTIEQQQSIYHEFTVLLCFLSPGLLWWGHPGESEALDYSESQSPVISPVMHGQTQNMEWLVLQHFLKGDKRRRTVLKCQIYRIRNASKHQCS